MPDDTSKTGRDRELPSLERLMALVDYYLHCELDEDHDRGRPEVARQQLEAALRQVLLHASRTDTVRDRLKSLDGTEDDRPTSVKRVG
jgi:hypothetical protein